MNTRMVQAAGALLTCAVLAGCCGRTTTVQGEKVRAVEVSMDLPRAQAGECYAAVFVPPKTETRTERLCVKEASERLEIIPAQYEWVEERVCVKDATTELVEVPAEMTWKEQRVEVAASHRGWVRHEGECRTEDGRRVDTDVFCLVNEPARYETIRTQVVAKPATVKQTTIPAEYQTVRRHKLVSPAKTRRVTIPAEYDEVQKTVVVAPGRMEWQRVICEDTLNDVTLNAIKGALLARGYSAGPMNGEFGEQDWNALKQYQIDRNLGVGKLTYQTAQSLGVKVQ